MFHKLAEFELQKRKNDPIPIVIFLIGFTYILGDIDI